MSLQDFIPEIWSAELLAALQKIHVYAALANKNYQGAIAQMGDTVRINMIGDPTISSYTKDTDISAAQALTDAQTTLVINQAKYFNFEVDDVDAAQQQPKVMSEAMNRAAYGIGEQIDQFVAGLYTDISTSNAVGSSGSFVTVTTPTNANVGGGTTVLDEIIVLGQLLTQNAVPKAGRWIVIPPWVTTYLMQDIRFSGFNTETARQAILSGKLDASNGMLGDAYIGKVAGFDVYESNNAPHLGGTVGVAGSQDVVIASHSMALTYADNVVKVEGYRPPLRFADAVKGLHLYGAKVIRPYAMAAAFLQHP